MKKLKNHKRDVLTVCLVAIWLTLSFYTETPTFEDVNIKTTTEETEKDSPQKVVSLKLTEALQQSVNINLDFQSILLEEILTTEEDEQDQPEREFTNKLSKSVRILLQKIISPNAP